MDIKEQTRLLRWLNDAERCLAELRAMQRFTPDDEELAWARHEVAVSIAETRARLRAATLARAA